jgi:hypothetical protein
MREEPTKPERPPLLVLPPGVRAAGALTLCGLAGAHLIWPSLAIDGVFLGLLAFGAFIWFFDVESIEWQGIKARRREIARAKASLDEAAPSSVKVVPPPAPAPKGNAQPEAVPPPADVPVQPDLNLPTNRFERLFWATEQIRIELILLAGNAGRLKRVAPWSEYHIPELVSYLHPANALSGPLIEAIMTVVRMRNAAAHEQVVDPAADLAVDVLQKLRSIHRNYVRLRYPDVQLFKDRGLTSPHQFPGVMVVQVDEQGTVQQPQVFPRQSEFHRGRFLSWSWEMGRVSREEAWYRDPISHAVKLAWREAATFVGREYPEQWGLEFRLPRPDLGLD